MYQKYLYSNKRLKTKMPAMPKCGDGQDRSSLFLTVLDLDQRVEAPTGSLKERIQNTMTKGLLSLLLLGFAGSANAAGAAEITQENFDTLTKGKNSFVKFVRSNTQTNCSFLPEFDEFLC